MLNSKIKNKCYILTVIMNNLMQNLLKVSAVLVILLLLVNACETEKKDTFRFNGKELNKIITAYLAGDSSSYSLAGFLFNNANPQLIKLNEFQVDSLVIPGKKTIYSLMVESQNPVYNLFALIDDKMNVLLKDNSLNGNLSGSFNKIENNDLFIIKESFKSKDSFNLKRTSLYKVTNNSAMLIFRALTEYSFGDRSIDSKITTFNEEKIVLTFNNINAPQFKEKTDEYLFDAISQRYSSENNFLRNFAINEINKFKTPPGLDEITDYSSFQRIFYNRNSEPVHSEITNSDFGIELSREWKQFDNFAITQFLKNEFKGYKFINEILGTTISIIKLPLRDSTEVYSDISLINQTVYQHPVRFSELIESGKYFYQLLEFKCGMARMLMMIETPKFTFEKNKEILEKIIKSFRVNC